MQNRSPRLVFRLVSALAAFAAMATLLTTSGNGAAQTKAPTRRIEPIKPAPTTPETEPARIPAPTDDDPNTEAKRAVYISGDFGFTRPDVGGFKNDLAFDKTAANGFLAGIGAGYRHKAFRFGVRYRDMSTTQFTLWSLMGEVGWGLPLKRITPILFLHAGYMFDTGIDRPVFASQLPSTNLLTPAVDLKGLVVGAEINAAFAVTKFFKVGPFIGFDVSFLHRSRAALPETIQPLSDATKNNALFGGTGSGIGYIFDAGLRVTGDIGF